jgi:hypothetical protein
LRASDRFSVKRRRQLLLRFVVTTDATVSVELRKGKKRVARVQQRAGAGRGTLRLRAPRTPGRHTLLLIASSDDGQQASDAARVRVKR